MKTTFKLAVAATLATLGLAAGTASAAVLDLTAAGASGTIGGALFTNVDNQSTGTGVIDPFVRISGGSESTIQGYNTSARPLTYDENSSPTWTRDLLLSEVPVVNIGGIDYLEFLLDINESKSTPLLLLDRLELRQGASGGASGTWGTFGTSVWSLGDNSVILNYALNNGSGSGDLFVYIPTSLLGLGDYLYLFSRFGAADGDENDQDAGFEEWAVRIGEGGTQVPEPTSLALVGLGLLGLGLTRRRKAA